MRNGYILLHRKGITEQEWKHPLRTLAWIDFLTMAAWEEFTAEDGVHFQRGEVVASYGFLAKRWRVSKDTAYCWIKTWIAERQVERRTERCAERHAERFFVLNYAKYQETAERVTERSAERTTERITEQMKRKHQKENSMKENKERPRQEKLTSEEVEQQWRQTVLNNGWCDEPYVEKTLTQLRDLAHDVREEFYRKARVMLRCAAASRLGLARKLYHETAGLVNDRGAMERVLTDQEIAERRQFAQEENGEAYVQQEL